MRSILIALMFLSVLCLSVSAQDKPIVYIQEGRQKIRFEINPVEPLDQATENLLLNFNTYKLYEIAYPDEPDKMHGVDVTPSLIDSTNSPECFYRCTRVDLHLLAPLDYGKTYILKVTNLSAGSLPSTLVRFDVAPVAEILASLDVSKNRKELRVQAQIPIQIDPNVTSIVVERKGLKLTPDKTKVQDHPGKLKATSDPAQRSTDNDLTLTLEKRLAEAQSYNLVVKNGIVDVPPLSANPVPSPIPVKAKGTIKVPGLPSPPDAPAIDFKIASAAAVNQKPLFDLTANLSSPTILHAPVLGYFEPKAMIDVGLGQTKSANSVILNFPFRRDFTYPVHRCSKVATDPCKERDDINQKMASMVLAPGELKTPTYYTWTQEPWFRLNSLRLFLSPLKLEADRKFQRINTLGSVRLEFNFYRWLAMIKDKRTRLAADLQDRADLVEISHGFKIVPYLSFDFGQHIKNETVKNVKKNKSLVVPRYDIVRGFLGLQTTLQWRLLFPMTLSVDESLIYLAATEKIGFVTDQGVALRQLRGFHHRGKAAWDIFLDPAKRYSFNISFENGRVAPNFEYLNKLSAGFRLVH